MSLCVEETQRECLVDAEPIIDIGILRELVQVETTTICRVHASQVDGQIPVDEDPKVVVTLEVEVSLVISKVGGVDVKLTSEEEAVEARRLTILPITPGLPDLFVIAPRTPWIARLALLDLIIRPEPVEWEKELFVIARDSGCWVEAEGELIIMSDAVCAVSEPGVKIVAVVDAAPPG